MIAPIIAATTAASLVNNLLNSWTQSPRVENGQAEFAKSFSDEIEKQSPTKPFIHSLQSLIASQRAQGSYSFDQQIALAQALPNKKVQVVDSSGNNVVGIVTETHFEKGQLYLTIKGQSYPISSLQAVLEGVNLK